MKARACPQKSKNAPERLLRGVGSFNCEET
jgi:hypothetical protein